MTTRPRPRSAEPLNWNDGVVSVEPGTPYRLADGDRIHVGAWTTIIVRRRP